MIMKCVEKNIQGKIQIFSKQPKTNTPTPKTGAKVLPPKGPSCMYIGTRSKNFGSNVYCSFERSVFLTISDISFSYFRYPADGNNKAMRRFRIQLLLIHNTWTTPYNIPEVDAALHQHIGH